MSAFDYLIAERIEMLQAITGEVEVSTDSISAMKPAYAVMHLDIVITLTKAGFRLSDAYEMCPAVIEFMVLGYSDRDGIERAASDLSHILQAFNIPAAAASATVLQIHQFGVDLAEPLIRLGTVAHSCGWTIRQTLAALAVIPQYGVEDRADLLRSIILEADAAADETETVQ